MSSYAEKSDLKKATGIDTPAFAKKADLASLRSDVNRIVIDKLGTTPTDLINFKYKVVKSEVKTVYDNLVKKS